MPGATGEGSIGPSCASAAGALANKTAAIIRKRCIGVSRGCFVSADGGREQFVEPVERCDGQRLGQFPVVAEVGPEQPLLQLVDRRPGADGQPEFAVV